MPSLFSVADYAQALMNIFPRGRAWPRDPDAYMPRVMAAFAPSFQRVDESAQDLLVDAFPATTVDLLPEWEESLGLPDPCAGESPTIQQRRGQVLARFIGNGGQSIAYYTEFAANLGYAITVTEFVPFSCGVSGCGRDLYLPSAAFCWAVNAPLDTLVHFGCGVSGCGEPLTTFGNAVLECELNAIAPAHTTLVFRFS